MIGKFRFFIAIFLFFALVNPAQAFSQDYTPSDPGIIYQNYFEAINIYPNWSNDIRVNKEVIVAVLDSGVDIDHPDLATNIWVNPGEIAGDNIDNDKNSYIDDINGWDFINSNNNPRPELIDGYDYTAVNHGTIVAGIIAAAANDQGIVGIAPQVKIMPLKILNEKGTGNTLVLSQAIDYAVANGADIINLSLVGDFYDENLRRSINNAYNKGVVIVAASGNQNKEGINLDLFPRYPVCEISSGNQVLGVAALDQDRRLAPFSNFGRTCIDISAPGMGFYSTVYHQVDNPEFSVLYKGGWNGTSLAAPIVSATAALLKMNFPELRPSDIYNILINSATDIKAVNPENYLDLGAGLVNVGAALNLAKVYINTSAQIVLAPEAGLAPEVLILDKQGNLSHSFLAYNVNFHGGVRLATGDLTGDGQKEIVTAPGAGGGPHIRVFNPAGVLISEFFAYDARFTGGVKVAIGDINGDGQKEIVTAPGAGGGPHIRVFSYQGDLISEFFAYEGSFRGGVNVALGDVSNDGKNEIIIAPESGREPEIKVFDYRNQLKSSFLAYDQKMTSGVNITVGNVTHDNWQEIITVPASGQAPQIKLFSMRGRLKGEFLAYNRQLLSGIKIIVRDISGDFLPEILTLPNKGSAALMRVYDHQGLEKDNLYLRNSSDRNGYYFDILDR